MRSSRQGLSNGLTRLSLAGLWLAAAFLSVGLRPLAPVLAAPGGEWIYLRGGVSPAPGENLVEVMAVGDLMPGRGLAGSTGLFDQVAEALQAADLALGNLEGAVVARSADSHTPLLLLPVESPEALAKAGFDLLGLANNHTLDAGVDGLVETARRLQAAGIEPLEHARPAEREMRGLKITFLAWDELRSGDRRVLLEALRSARPDVDIVIVLVHWGPEYQRHPALAQRELAEAVFEAGADIILGSHPHVVQNLEIVQPEAPDERAAIVAYSLGNFAFDQGWDDTRQGLALRLFFDRDGLRAAQAMPVWTAPRPSWMDPGEAEPLLERILPERRVGFTCSQGTCQGAPAPQEQRSGLFWSGAIDLTGDGQPEIVRRLGQVVEIYQDSQLIYRSPPEWSVLDAALGDPNDDGRYELLLALEKTARSGEITSHPFIVGYRGGIFRLLWGGSQVSAPLLEVEVGDLNGDGFTELAAIEAARDRAERYITVWRWHGWGFSLLWRSPAGDYHDLSILPAMDDNPPRLSAAVGRSTSPAAVSPAYGPTAARSCESSVDLPE